MDIPYIPYFQTSRYRVAAMIELAEINRSLPAGRQERAADLGTGDGRIAIALAKAGAVVDAYELDEKMIALAKENIEKEFSHPVIPSSEPGSSSLNTVILGQHGMLTPESRNDPGQALMTKPTILKKDFWYEDLSKYAIVCCYPMPTIMGRLEDKLRKELKPGARILLNYFPFTHWKLEKTKDNIFLYKKY